MEIPMPLLAVSCIFYHKDIYIDGYFKLSKDLQN